MKINFNDLRKLKKKYNQRVMKILQKFHFFLNIRNFLKMYLHNKKKLMLQVKKKKPVESTVLFLVFYLKFYTSLVVETLKKGNETKKFFREKQF